MEKVPGLITGISSYSGEDIANVARQMFGQNIESISTEQLALISDYLVPSQYLLRNHRIKNGRQKFTFDIPGYGDGDPRKAFSHRPWQRDIVNDQSRNLVIEKSRQLGMSEIAVASMLWWADSHSSYGVKCLYAFPTYRQMNTFIKMRLNPVLDSTPYYRSIIDPNVNSVENKKIRDAFLSFRTSSKSGAVEGLDVDYVALDEYDRVSPSASQSAQQSLSSSAFKMFRRFSTPTSPGTGIDDLFEHSDQRVYMHKCTHCGYWNEMKYADYNPTHLDSSGNILMLNKDGVDYRAQTIVPGTYQFVCQKCGKPLDRWYNGQFVAKFPERSTNAEDGIRGYRISQMNAVWVSLDMIKNAELHAKSKQAFYNYVLGYPFQDVKLQMSDADIENIGRFPEPILDRRDYALISVGIDWGVKNSIVVMGMRENGLVDILNVTQTNSEGAVSPLGAGADIQAIRLALMTYKPDIIVADVGDHGNRIAELMKVYGSDRVYGGKYSSNPTMGLSTASNRIVPSWSDSANLVTMDKLVENKRLIDIIKQGEIGIWKKHDDGLLTYIDHWKNVVIRDEEQDDGSMRQVIGRKGGDHYAQASVLAMVGLDHLREQLYGNSSYDFAYADLDSHLKPEKTDLAKGLDNNIFG